MQFKLPRFFWIVDSLKSPKTSRPWAVIGAGIGGMASAIRLKNLGFAPEIFEGNSFPGGKLSEFSFSGFRFDAGPSLFTMPEWLGELFVQSGKKLEDYFEYITLEESSRYFFEDGICIHGYTDPDKLAKEIESKTQDSRDSVRKFLKYSSRIYGITRPVFLEKSLHKLSTYFQASIIPSILGLPYIDSGRTMHVANSRFFRDPKTIQIMDRYATYNGSNPYRAPATLNVIPHLEYGFGAFFPKKGMISITEAIQALIRDLEIPIHYNAKVEEILFEGNRVKGIRTAGKDLPFSGVISNMDIYHTYHSLMPGMKFPGKTLKRERSSSALIFYWGINRNFPELDLHNIFFSENYEKEFNEIGKGILPSDPTIYINITSKFKKGDAPEGMENWFTMINVPANSGQDWDIIKKQARERILQKLGRMLNTDLEKNIQAEQVLDPVGIESRTSSYQGSLYGSSSNHPFSAFFRHPNFSSTYSGLYFVGGSVHPGGGIPLALLSAKITSEIILQKEKPF